MSNRIFESNFSKMRFLYISLLLLIACCTHQSDLQQPDDESWAFPYFKKVDSIHLDLVLQYQFEKRLL